MGSNTNLYSVANGNPVIREIKLGWSSSSLNNTITVGPPLLATNLAAAYDPLTKKRLIVYQNVKTLRMVDDSGTVGTCICRRPIAAANMLLDSEIPNTADSQDSTGIALVTVKSDGEDGVKLYLYYFASKGALLQRVVRNEKGVWGPSSVVSGAHAAETSTFLTASLVKHEGKSKIILFYIDKITGDNKPTMYVFQDEQLGSA
jgi:hypothetical protein